MRFITFLAAGHLAMAYPGMGKLLADLQKMQTHENHHNSRAPAGFLGSTTVLGDLANLPDSSLTPVGSNIKAILSGNGGQPLGDGIPLYDAPGPLGSASCNADACCVHKYAMLDMYSMFSDPASGGCSALARAAIRLGFHDAAAWDTNAGYGGGGADGSIILSPAELARPVNNGLQAIANQTWAWYERYHQYGASMADLIQLAAMTAVVSCPGGPRMRFYVGRVDNTNPAQDNLLPDPLSGADTIAALFAAKTFTPGGLAALIGAHTVSQQFYVAPAQAGASQDVTPGVWDNNYYNVTLAATPPAGVYRFPSDVALAQSSGAAATFQFFGTQAGRSVWQTAFASEYLRLSLLGVYNINSMTDCTHVLPQSTFQG
ncbi:hypothetical protein SEUCBS139899_006592 [Sporothrix eucalyptigena]|uniref:Peroxidase n=1 Tax=Sporothrix eucalyptigena TaxID=1812306 RepID=A0ABP0B2J2_9PEZI